MTSHRTTRVLTTALLVLPAAALTASADAAPAAPTSAPTSAPTPAHPAPTRFDHPRANPWFPLRPGTVWVFRGTDEGRRLTQRTTVSQRHRLVDGVRTTVVLDVVRRADGSVAERTHDWYAADDAGRVWYFGEATATYDRQGRLVDREGSWEAGRDGARAGVIMPARPHPTDAYRQEYRAGDAEDQAWVVERGARVRTPAVATRHALRTFEWSRLEPRVVSTKLYARGYGVVVDQDVAGGDERFVLVRMRRG